MTMKWRIYEKYAMTYLENITLFQHSFGKKDLIVKTEKKFLYDMTLYYAMPNKKLKT